MAVRPEKRKLLFLDGDGRAHQRCHICEGAEGTLPRPRRGGGATTRNKSATHALTPNRALPLPTGLFRPLADIAVSIRRPCYGNARRPRPRTDERAPLSGGSSIGPDTYTGSTSKDPPLRGCDTPLKHSADARSLP
ncbi:hypothetical protein MTO96_013242 [Rhipicephalus appendiculatus]